VKLAVVLFNLGGPDSLDAVEPFLRNLFGDPAILSVPGIVRRPLARVIASRRAPVAREIYKRIGGRSPIVEETRAQANALDKLLAERGMDAKSFIAMRCWHPFSDEAAKAVSSSFADWVRAAHKAGLNVPTSRLCCYPDSEGFITAEAELIHQTLTRVKPGVSYRLLLSAHGLPKRTIAKGDPYQWQVERTAAAIVDRLGIKVPDWRVCYQSRVGPLAWIGPATDAEIRRAGAEGKGVAIAPIAFVSEHSETLVELDMEYAHLALNAGVKDYLRVPTVSAHAKFIEALADLVMLANRGKGTLSGRGARICPRKFGACPCME